MTVILASSSPRRRELLASLGVTFWVAPSGLEERDPLPGEHPVQYALALARQKAEHVASHYPSDIVLAADTVVAVDEILLNKPICADDALRMLRLLRGREHQVTTAVVTHCGGQEHPGYRTARVVMGDFSDDEARDYVASGEPMDKAGAYAVQGYGGRFVVDVKGCYNAVVGLPLCLTSKLLGECGLAVEVPEGAVCSVCSE